MDKKFAVSNHVCECCGREFGDINNGVCPSDDCPSNMESAQHHAHLTPESLASSQAVSNASAVSQSDSDTPPAQAQVA